MITKFRVLKTAELTKRCEEHHRSPAIMLSFIVFHPLQLLARRDLSRSHITKGITWNNRL
jgi:hypothetical protein